MSDQAILVRFSTSLREKKRDRNKNSFYRLKANSVRIGNCQV